MCVYIANHIRDTNEVTSIRFMANELMTDGQSKTEASDVYSFAMLMIEVGLKISTVVLESGIHTFSGIYWFSTIHAIKK